MGMFGFNCIGDKKHSKTTNNKRHIYKYELCFFGYCSLRSQAALAQEQKGVRQMIDRIL